MSTLRKMAEIPAGSWTKWVVVGFWVVVLVLAFPLSKKLQGAEKNDAKYWLPGAAESTKVLDVQERFQSPNIITGVVVYERASGLTAADRAKAAADARRFAGIPGVVPGQLVGAGRLGRRLPGQDHLDHYRPGPGRPGAWPDRAEGQWPDQRARIPYASRLGDRRDRARRSFPRRHGPARHRDRQPKRGGRAAVRLRRHPGHHGRDPAGDPGGLRLPRGHAARSARQPGRVRHDRPGAGRGARRSRR